MSASSLPAGGPQEPLPRGRRGLLSRMTGLGRRGGRGVATAALPSPVPGPAPAPVVPPPPAPRATRPARTSASATPAPVRTKSPAAAGRPAAVKPPAPRPAPAAKPAAAATPAKFAATPTPAAAPKRAAAPKTASAKPAAPAETPAKQPVTKPAAAKPATAARPRPARAAAGDGEAWTPAELGEIRSLLEAEAGNLRREIDEAARALDDVRRDGSDGTGDDQADAGTATFEREHEMSLANNSRDLLVQTERALKRLDNGTYGVCEVCGTPIAKARLLAFPRATLCVRCKQREERR